MRVLSENTGMSLILVVGLIGASFTMGGTISALQENDKNQDKRLDMQREAILQMTTEIKTLNATMLRIEKQGKK